MRFLIVGSGSIGRRHLANLRQLYADGNGCHITLMVRPESARRARKLQPAPDDIVHSVEGALRNEIDAAIIASPSSHHLATAQPLAEHGVHLLIEKPIADSLDGVDKLIATCTRNKCVLMVGYNLRFDPALQAMKTAIDEGLIGRPVGLRAEVGQYLPDWRPDSDYRQAVSAKSSLGGGALLELSHELDYAQWLLGDITSVSANVGQVSDLELDVEDFAELNVRFENGAIGNIHLDFVQRDVVRKCRIIGTDGTLLWDAIAGTARVFQSSTKTWEDLPFESSEDRNQMYLDEVRDFTSAIENGDYPAVSGTDGRRALAVALAAGKSSSKGMTVSVEHIAEPSRQTAESGRAIGFVFARGGSKGLPGKNLRELAGKPLIAHAIELAQASHWIDRVVVSTEDPQIALTARSFGAEVPFMRPEHLASDTAAEWLAWQHAIREIHKSGDLFDTFVSVPATSPLRSLSDLNSCVELLQKHRGDTDIVISVCEAHRSPWFNMVTVDENGRADLVMTGENKVHRRQDAPTVFDITTVAYAATADFIMSASSIFEGRVRAVVVPVENAVDIDTEQDFRQAEFLLQFRSANEFRKAG